MLNVRSKKCFSCFSQNNKCKVLGFYFNKTGQACWFVLTNACLRANPSKVERSNHPEGLIPGGGLHGYAVRSANGQNAVQANARKSLRCQLQREVSAVHLYTGVTTRLLMFTEPEVSFYLYLKLSGFCAAQLRELLPLALENFAG